jgi:hypothetical protein
LAVTPDQATAWVTGNTIDINAGDGDFLTCAAVVHDLLIIFKGRTTWGLYVSGTSSADWTVRSLNRKIGCVSKYTPRVIDGICHFVSANSVYRTDGTSFKSISDPIQPILKDRVVNISNANIDAAFYWNEMYVVLLQPDPSTTRYFAYHVKANGWTEWTIGGGFAPSFFIEIQASTPTAGVYAGDMNLTGNAFRFGKNVYTDMGVAYTCKLQTKYYDFGLMESMKRGKWMAVNTIGQATLTYSHVVNAVEGAAAVVTSDPLNKIQKNLGPGYFRSWSYKLSVDSANAFSFLGFVMYYHRRGKAIPVNA